jgi:hypothetical protein
MLASQYCAISHGERCGSVLCRKLGRPYSDVGAILATSGDRVARHPEPEHASECCGRSTVKRQLVHAMTTIRTSEKVIVAERRPLRTFKRRLERSVLRDVGDATVVKKYDDNSSFYCPRYRRPAGRRHAGDDVAPRLGEARPRFGVMRVLRICRDPMARISLGGTRGSSPVMKDPCELGRPPAPDDEVTLRLSTRLSSSCLRAM